MEYRGHAVKITEEGKKWQFKMDCPIMDIKVKLMAIGGYLVTLEKKRRRGEEI